MRRPRIHVPVPLQGDATITLNDRTSRYITQVLRLKPGAPLTLFDGEGGEYQAVLTMIKRHNAVVETGEFVRRECESPLPITLAQGISRGERMDFTLQKVTELGVHRIIPLLTERCGVRLQGERRDKRQHHWQGIITSACEQCGRNRLPVLDAIHDLPCWLSSLTDQTATALVLDPQARIKLSAMPRPAAQPLLLLIGPEGGLSESEIEMAEQSGFTRIGLGPRILRTETASIAILAALQVLWGDLA